MSKTLGISLGEIDNWAFYQNWSPPTSKKFDEKADLHCLISHLDSSDRTCMNYIISLPNEQISQGSIIVEGPEEHHRLLQGLGDVVGEVLSNTKWGYTVMLVGDFFPPRILQYLIDCQKTAKVIDLLRMVWQTSGKRVLICSHSQARTKSSLLEELRTGWYHGPAFRTPQSRKGLKISLHNCSRGIWEKEWSQSKGCRQSKLWFPTFSLEKSNYIRQLNRQELGPWVQFITGHSFLRRHQHLVTSEGEPVCRLCKEDVEDSEHLFSSCVGLRSERFDILHHHRLPNPLKWEPTELSRFLRIPSIVELMCSPGEE